jgi:hypothetical protein
MCARRVPVAGVLGIREVLRSESTARRYIALAELADHRADSTGSESEREVALRDGVEGRRSAVCQRVGGFLVGGPVADELLARLDVALDAAKVGREGLDAMLAVFDPRGDER